MAHAKRENPHPPPPPDQIVLNLSLDEAQYLLNLTGVHVLGRGPNRRLNGEIFRALSGALDSLGAALPAAEGESTIYLTD